MVPPFHLAVVLSVFLRPTAYEYPFDIYINIIELSDLPLDYKYYSKCSIP
jgi:hypothetical protein